MKQVGLIVNPMAGRDIRRLVARASLTSSTDKMQAARRIVAGIVEASAAVLMVDDWEGMGRILHSEYPKVIRLISGDGPERPGAPGRTQAWTRALEAEGASVLMVVGGDGTQRNAAEAHPTIPLLAMAGGTNNVACWLGDETVAGYAAGMWATHKPPLSETGIRAKVIHVQSERDPETLALIDVAFTRQRYTGALAVWHADDVSALMMAVADPARPGLSNVGGMVSPVAPEEDEGLALTLTDSPKAAKTVRAVLAPGLIQSFSVAHAERVGLGRSVRWSSDAGGTLALDGERTVVLAPAETAVLEIRRDGPWFLHPGRVLDHPGIR